MASWIKLLRRMVADPRPISYTYDEAALILRHLGFEPPSKPTGSHRKFRLEIEDPAADTGRRGIIIGLVENGHGPMKAVYVREMVRVLRENGLLPEGVD